MAHGHPDFGPQSTLATVYSLQDMAELAARLGSIVNFDRRGNVMWLDDFESGIGKWLVSYYGAGYAVASNSERARNGAFSCKLTTGPEDGYTVVIGRQLPYPVLSNLGLEVSVLLLQYWDKFRFNLDLMDGTYRHRARVYYDDGEHKFYYYDVNGVAQETGITVDFETSDPVFHTVKLVADFVNHTYKRLIVDNQAVDLSGIAYQMTASSEFYLDAYFTLVCSSTLHPAIAYVDDAIITQNEP